MFLNDDHVFILHTHQHHERRFVLAMCYVSECDQMSFFIEDVVVDLKYSLSREDLWVIVSCGSIRVNQPTNEPTNPPGI